MENVINNLLYAAPVLRYWLWYSLSLRQAVYPSRTQVLTA